MKMTTIAQRLKTSFPRMTEDDALIIFGLLADRHGFAWTAFGIDDLKARGVKGSDEHLRFLMRCFNEADNTIDAIVPSGSEILDDWLHERSKSEGDVEFEEDEA
jgi:hypothetical protein